MQVSKNSFSNDCEKYIGKYKHYPGICPTQTDVIDCEFIFLIPRQDIILLLENTK